MPKASRIVVTINAVYTVSGKESLPKRIERAELIHARQQELASTKARLNKEKQFNRKVEINAEIRTIK